MTMDPATELRSIRSAYEAAVTARATAEGRLQQIMETLKKDFNVNSPKAADVLLAKLGEQLTAKEAELVAAITKLKEDFQWD